MRYSRRCGKSLTRIAWEEFRVAKQFSAPQSYETYLAQDGHPGWFWAYELGHAQGEAPSLEYNLAHLEELNRKNRAYLASISTLPKLRKSKRQKLSPRQQRNRMQKLLQGYCEQMRSAEAYAERTAEA